MIQFFVNYVAQWSNYCITGFLFKLLEDKENMLQRNLSIEKNINQKPNSMTRN